MAGRSRYWFGWREASAAIVLMPVCVRAAAMFGLSSPECSPVTSADLSNRGRLLAWAHLTFCEISLAMVAVGTHVWQPRDGDTALLTVGAAPAGVAPPSSV